MKYSFQIVLIATPLLRVLITLKTGQLKNNIAKHLCCNIYQINDTSQIYIKITSR